MLNKSFKLLLNVSDDVSNNWIFVLVSLLNIIAFLYKVIMLESEMYISFVHVHYSEEEIGEISLLKRRQTF